MRHLMVLLFILWVLIVPSLGLTQGLICPELSEVAVSSGDKEDIVEICLAQKSA